MRVWVDGAVPGCLKEMETVGRGALKKLFIWKSGKSRLRTISAGDTVPCARYPPGTLTSNIWVSLLSGEL